MLTTLLELWSLIQASPWISSLIGVVLATYVIPALSQKFPQLSKLWAVIGEYLAKVFPPAPPQVQSSQSAGPPAVIVTEPTTAALQHLLADAIKHGDETRMDKVSALAKEYQSKIPLALLLFAIIGLAGCAAEKSSPTQDCHRSGNYGYVQPPPAEKDRMYHEEPTLFQQEPDLANPNLAK
jgi:hypothetical protein